MRAGAALAARRVAVRCYELTEMMNIHFSSYKKNAYLYASLQSLKPLPLLHEPDLQSR
jgi:hypothetical protein